MAFPMGLVQDGFFSFTRGELAIGPAADTERSITYRLAERAYTSTPAFSFWFDDADAKSGNLLFGAVDTSAFEGPLQLIDARSSESRYHGLPVDFSILNYTSPSGGDPSVIAPQNDLPLILIHPTTMLTNLPATIAQKIWDLAGATYDEPSGIATIPCAGGNGSAWDSELIFGMGIYGKATARVAVADLVIPNDVAPLSDGDTCYFGIQSMGDDGELSDDAYGPWTIGGFVLRNTYVVFDLYNEQVAFAPVRADASSADGGVLTFSAYGATVPESEAADGGDDGCASWGCERTMPGDPPRSAVLSITALVLMVVALVLVLAISCTSVWFCWYKGYCCWRGRRKPKDPPAVPQSGAIAEKVIYAGEMPPGLPPRSQPYTADQLPLGMAMVTPMVPYPPPVAQAPAPPHGNPRGPASPEGQPAAGQPVTAPHAVSEDVPPGRSVSPPASPTPGPSASRPVSPTTNPPPSLPLFPTAGPSASASEPTGAPATEIVTPPEDAHPEPAETGTAKAGKGKEA